MCVLWTCTCCTVLTLLEWMVMVTKEFVVTTNKWQEFWFDVAEIL